MTHRKIIHCDADCFYAAIEMRDNPEFREIPLAVGGSSERRGVIATCNYMARQFGVRSAMSSAKAKQLCPNLVIVPPNMDKYRQASSVMREVFNSFTDIVEPLSLDEAYLDVTNSTDFSGSATHIAQSIRQQIQQKIGITVSAGVSNSKFLAKIASDWHKPNGLKVITPEQVDSFVQQLPVGKIHGVGKVTTAKLSQMGITTCHDLRAYSLADLDKSFGSFGKRLYELARGIDNRPVTVSRIRKSISVERTFEKDIRGIYQCQDKLTGMLSEFEKRLQRLPKELTLGKAFVKIKFSDFTTTTLEKHGTSPSFETYYQLIESAIRRKNLPIRLMGIGARLNPPPESSAQLDLFDVEKSIL